MQNLIALYRLQQADTQIEVISQELEELRNAIPGASELAQAEAAFESVRAEKREAERVQKDAELELATLETERKQVETKLYGGKVVNSKELSGLERDLQQFNRRREKLDDQVLRGMDSLEKVNHELRIKEKAYQETKARVEERKKAHESRVALLSRQLAELKGRREEYAHGLEEELLERYVGLRERKGGVAVATLQRSSCSACYMIVPDSTIKKVRVLELEYCSSCGRILYLDKEQ